MSDDVSDDGSIYDETDCDEDCVASTESVLEYAEGATSDDYCCN
jgi:hypothetical protein